MTNIRILRKTEQVICRLLRSVRKSILTSELAGAEFVPFIQPVYQSGELVGCEVLMRVKKNGVLHSPESYLSVIESGEVCNDVTCELLEKVKAHFTPHVESLPKGFYFSFNICAQQLNSSRMVKAVKEFNIHFGKDIMVILEIVERGTLEFDDFALDAMQELVASGVGFSIDDYGSGGSCLKYIEHAGFSTIKIDKCLTMVCNHKLIYSSVIDAIMSFSEKLNLHIIAEGVETNEQFKLLEMKGIDTFQGYLFSRPVSMREFCAHILLLHSCEKIEHH
ncbi:hypothetical protein C3432_17670 [Citrobacter amalonaticus]|uniref:EAL domain-containing protein n=1 Tax=Citrobacter amalonaticus TaxID=35703 RepID=A0A2S4RTQ1_CITAM|nr:EAL domain-containing protein [Citrobacter amalonaticus]POT57184.1 hypothetical protein C3432_17670 [Citrobacter amalonaticus]POT72527.1 hypothetical protein C3436_20215 [Citrobacter amalonaticus]POU63382.1 hypothetical protein C3430_18470 [Citrobacter amalonaticus]POV03146.1 hypothetical protein C3424_21385 [Citrobacter amalonaticus]